MELNDSTTDNLILKLFDAGAVKFGEFTLKSGIKSPVYFDLRVMVSYPEIMKEVSEVLWNIAEKMDAKFDSICGVPYTALPIATLMSVEHRKPMLIRRKEAKDYGTAKMIEGHFEKGDKCLVVEDIVTSGSSIFETSESLVAVGLKVTDAVVLLDRCQGGSARLQQHGIKTESAFTIRKVLDVLVQHEKIKLPMKREVEEFIDGNQFESKSIFTPRKISPEVLTYAERAKLCKNPVARKLLNLIEEKQTNLAFAADVTDAEEFLKLADVLGPHICIFKTHIDILKNFSSDVVTKLKALAVKHRYLIFEDRKFADIGGTVKHQYRAGVHKIVEWADIVNAHPVPGHGVVEGLKEAATGKQRGCLLIAEMSSKGNLATGQYTAAAVKMAEEMSDFVIGFISQSAVSAKPYMIHMTPGVKLVPGSGTLGQQYVTPQQAIVEKGSDIIIVGRDIYEASNRVGAAANYKKVGYQAYCARMFRRKDKD
ncbi:uridine 5'-monophosphate synthase-like [Apostichopus japonicus]|uniref:uridine 5'-monophosphate synthase-like n=1 Tax=Stichopus japonicus TaxID=307972 RepID=UPI003AB869B6